MKSILIAARAKIATPETWTQGVLARDIYDDSRPDNHLQANNVFWSGLSGRDPRACKFCALGAVQAATADDNRFQEVRTALDSAAFDLFSNHNIAHVNDDLGHAAVLQCYDHAIEAAE